MMVFHIGSVRSAKLHSIVGLDKVQCEGYNRLAAVVYGNGCTCSDTIQTLLLIRKG
jgi:hypothetical protein